MEEMVSQLLRQVKNKFFGKYRGLVVDNKDPEKRGRLQLKIPSVLGTETSAWALPCVPFGGRPQQGSLFLPDVDAQIWVEFEEGNIHQPIWTGTFWQEQNQAPEESQAPETRVFRSSSGHVVIINDQKDKEQMTLQHKSGSKLFIDEKGSIRIETQNGDSICLNVDAKEIRIEDASSNVMTFHEKGTTVQDSNGNTIEMAASGIKLKGQQVTLEGQQVFLGGPSSEPVIKGQSFLTLFATHVHTATSLGGPTSPPIPQGEASSLSLSVFVK